MNTNATKAEYLTSHEAAALLRISRGTLVRLARQGEIPGARRYGGSWRFDLQVLTAPDERQAA